MSKRVKWCSKCKHKLPISKFSKNKIKKDGFDQWCKVCKAKYHKTYYQIRKTETNKRHKAYQQTDQGKAVNTKAQIKYRQTHRTEIAERRQQYRQAHKTEAAEYAKKHQRTLKGCLSRRLANIKQRCNNPNNPAYKNYGANNIKCLFTFSEFIDCVIGLGYDTYEKLRGLEIHRINNSDHYKPGNIEFLIRAEHRAKHDELRRLQKQVA